MRCRILPPFLNFCFCLEFLFRNICHKNIYMTFLWVYYNKWNKVATFKHKPLILWWDSERDNFTAWWMRDEDIDQLLTELLGWCINWYHVVQQLIFLIMKDRSMYYICLLAFPALTLNIILWRSTSWVFIIFMLLIYVSGCCWNKDRVP